MLLVILAQLAAVTTAQWTIGQQVKTTSGNVIGHAATWPKDSGVSEYLGIPFAKPPVGPLRFMPPQPYSSDNVFKADNFANDCVQYTKGAGAGTPKGSSKLTAYSQGMGGGSPGNPHNYTEDCLGINIWAKPQSGEKSKAVLLWIYGGGFYAGASNAPYYNGARLAADEDVVVVSFNYRINIFGFPRAPGLDNYNPGLMDQRLATEWVRDNIAKFGGDPKRITLFGESAGGYSVDHFAYAWTKDPIVNGFIAESGTAGASRGAPSSAANQFANWYTVSNKLGCGGQEAGNKTLECMRQKTSDEIINAVGTLSGGVQGAFGPSPDGKVVFDNPKALADAGNIIKRPLLVGNNDNEPGLNQALGGMLRPPPASPKGAPPKGSGSPPPSMDQAFSCPSGAAAEVRIKNGVKAWRYRYMPTWENLALIPGIGAYHSAEIPLVFGSIHAIENPPDSPEEEKLTKYMMHAWAEFSKDPENGLSKLGWPVYDPNKDTLIRLGYNNQSALNLGPAKQYDVGCPM